MKQDSLALPFPVPFPMSAERKRLLRQVLHGRLIEVEQILVAHDNGENLLEAPDKDYINWVAGLQVFKRRLNAALSRLEKFGSYGRCCRCKLEIEIKLLKPLPFKPTCRLCDRDENLAHQKAEAEKNKPPIFR